MKDYGIKIKIAAWTVVLIICIAIFTLSFIHKKSAIAIDFTDRKNYVIVKEISVNEMVNDLSVEWVSGNVNVLKSTDDAVHIVQKAKEGISDNQLFTYTVSGEKLIVIDHHKNGWSFFNFRGNYGTELELYLPEKQYESFHGNFVSSDVIAKEMKVKKMKLNNVSGNTYLSGNFESVNLDSTSGNIDFTGSLMNGDGNISSVSGGVSINEVVAPKLNIQSTSGNMDVKGSVSELLLDTVSGDMNIITDVPLKKVEASSVSGCFNLTMQDVPGFTLDFSRVSGDFQSDFPTIKKEGKYIYKNGEVPIKMSTTSGDFKLHQK